VKVAAIQHDIVWEDPPATFAHVAPMIAEAAEAGARLVLLTEMFSTGFSMETDRIAEPVDGPSTQLLRGQAAEHGVWVGASVPERPEGEPLPYNTFVLAAPDGTVHRYAKIHPFSYAREHERFAAGTDHVTVDVEGLRCSLFVCYDLRFADEFWALAHTTDCYLVVANWPASRREHWRALLVARAIENQAYVVGVNRVGRGGGLDYAGDSRIVDPLGEVLAEAGDVETVLLAEVDPARVEEVRAKFPFLADRR
jgi:predicted amidohydrolase